MLGRSLQVSVVNPKKAAHAAASETPIDPNAISDLVKDQVQNTAIVVVAAYACITLLHTVSEIAINAAPKKH